MILPPPPPPQSMTTIGESTAAGLAETLLSPCSPTSPIAGKVCVCVCVCGLLDPVHCAVCVCRRGLERPEMSWTQMCLVIPSELGSTPQGTTVHHYVCLCGCGVSPLIALG